MSAPTDHLTFEVLVEDHIDQRLAGHAGCRYHSPAHTRQQAAALVHALLGTLSCV